MKTWLAIETATEACSVALACGDLLWEDSRIAPNQHSQLLLPMIQGVLERGDLSLAAVDAIACGIGPGGFTAVRLGISTAQGLAQALARPLYPVSSLQALAAGDPHPATLVAMDARRSEVYAAAFLRDGDDIPRLLGQERVIRPEDLAWPPPLPAGAGLWAGIGTGWNLYASLWQGGSPVSWSAGHYPKAREVLSLARYRWKAEGDQGISPEAMEPHYIRPSQAEEKR